MTSRTRTPTGAGTEPAAQGEVPKIDWTALRAKWEAERAAAREARKVERAELLALRDRSVKEPWRTTGRPGYAADAA